MVEAVLIVEFLPVKEIVGVVVRGNQCRGGMVEGVRAVEKLRVARIEIVT